MTSKNQVIGPPGNMRSWAIWAAAASFYLYEFAVRVAPSVMVEELQAAFSVTTTQLAGALAAYYYIYAPLQIFVGVLFDRFGGKRFLVPAALIVGIGCLVANVSEGALGLLTLSRVLMGFGSAFGFVGVMYLASVWFPHSRLALISGLTTGLGMLGAIMGEHTLSLYVDSLGWDASWLYFAGLGVVTAAAMLFAIPGVPAWEVKRRKNHFNGYGIGSFLESLIVVIKKPQSWIIGLIATALYTSLSIFGDQWGVQYLMRTYGFDKTKAAGMVSMVYFGWLVGGPVIGILSDTLKTRKQPVVIGCLVGMLAFGSIICIPTLPEGWLYAILFIGGLGSSAEVTSFVANMEINPNFARGSAVAFTNMLVMMVGGILQHLFGYIIDLVENLSWGSPETAYRIAMSALPLTMLIGFILSLKMNESYFCDEEEA